MLKINKIKVKVFILIVVSIVVFIFEFEFGKCVLNKENVCKKKIEAVVKADTYFDFIELREKQNESKLYLLRKARRKTRLKIIPCKSSFQEKVAYLTFDDGPSQDITLIVLNHDSSAGKETTVKVLPSIINDLRSRGYIFKALGE